MSDYSAILFDLDGTLLPMDLEVFTRAYFKAISAVAAQLGHDRASFMNAMQQGIAAMTFNDGKKTNREAFWSAFGESIGSAGFELEKHFESFYTGNFSLLKAVTGEDPYASRIIELARKKADKVVLATNPIFPVSAVRSRLGWIGLSESDFDLITTYETSRYCKPNRDYFGEIFQKLGVSGEGCLMVGNDVLEDTPAAAFGADIYLLDHSLIDHGMAYEDYKRGSFEDLIAFLG